MSIRVKKRNSESVLASPSADILPAGVATALIRLGRPGAIAVVSAAGAIVTTSRTRANARRRFSALAMQAFAVLRDAGWLRPKASPFAPGAGAGDALVPVADGAGDALQVFELSDAGQQRLRAHLMEPLALPDLTAGRPSHKRRQPRVDEVPARKPGIIEQLHARKNVRGVPLVTLEHVAAGQRLALDFERAALQPRVTQSWDPAAHVARGGFKTGGAGERDAAMQAHGRVHAALDAVGSDMAGLLLDVCCLDTGLLQVERNRGWPEGAARIVLQVALQRLAEHYGLVRRVPPDIANHIRHWAESGFRPGV